MNSENLTRDSRRPRILESDDFEGKPTNRRPNSRIERFAVESNERPLDVFAVVLESKELQDLRLSRSSSPDLILSNSRVYEDNTVPGDSFLSNPHRSYGPMILGPAEPRVRFVPKPDWNSRILGFADRSFEHADPPAVPNRRIREFYNAQRSRSRSRSADPGIREFPGCFNPQIEHT